MQSLQGEFRLAVAFDRPSIVATTREFCSLLRRTCPIEGGANVETGTPFTFDSDVTAYGRLMNIALRLRNFLNPDDSSLGYERMVTDSHHIYRYAKAEELLPLVWLWETTVGNTQLGFGGLSFNPEQRTWMPGKLPTIKPEWLTRMENAAAELDELLSADVKRTDPIAVGLGPETEDEARSKPNGRRPSVSSGNNGGRAVLDDRAIIRLVNVAIEERDAILQRPER